MHACLKVSPSSPDPKICLLKSQAIPSANTCLRACKDLLCFCYIGAVGSGGQGRELESSGASGSPTLCRVRRLHQGATALEQHPGIGRASPGLPKQNTTQDSSAHTPKVAFAFSIACACSVVLSWVTSAARATRFLFAFAVRLHFLTRF